MTIPMVGLDGVRLTVNTGLSTAQIVWNLRSALNVAALNCMTAEHGGVLANYVTFLDRYETKLSATNRALASEFRGQYGPAYRDVQDSYMTRVYNYFALPPAQDRFCDTALAVSAEAVASEVVDLDVFAAQALPRIEREFETFFRAYEQYRTDLAAWDARYGPPVAEVRTTFYGSPAVTTMASTSDGSMPTGQMPGGGSPAQSQEVIFVPGAATSQPTAIETTAIPASDAAPLPTQGPIILPEQILQSPGSDGPIQDGGSTGGE